MHGFQLLGQVLAGLVKAVGAVVVIVASVMAFFGLAIWLFLWSAK